MDRILIFGNSGSGKSTLARHLGKERGLAHLDLDTLAWLPEMPPRRAPLATSAEAIQRFLDAHAAWVIEGCYSDLLQLVTHAASELVFLNLPVANCLDNARARPWEPHKYPSPEAQNANLDMLLDWIRHYEIRQDEFSCHAHLALYDAFPGPKRMLRANQPLQTE